MDRQGLLTFLRRHRLCVQASVAADGGPQAAVVGYAVSDQFELIFDTLASTRKAQNLRRDARIAIVVGWDGEQTLQLEGLADEPSGRRFTALEAALPGCLSGWRRATELAGDQLPAGPSPVGALQ